MFKFTEDVMYFAPLGIFGAIASIVDAIFGKAKIYKLFVDFCFAKIVF